MSLAVGKARARKVKATVRVHTFLSDQAQGAVGAGQTTWCNLRCVEHTYVVLAIAGQSTQWKLELMAYQRLWYWQAPERACNGLSAYVVLASARQSTYGVGWHTWCWRRHRAEHVLSELAYVVLAVAPSRARSVN